MTYQPLIPNLFAQYLGDGSDGAVTVTNGQTLNLGKNMSYTTLVVQSGGIIETNGWKIFATSSIDIQAGGTVQTVVPAPTSPGSATATTNNTTNKGWASNWAGQGAGAAQLGVAGLAAAGGNGGNSTNCYGGRGGFGGGIGAGQGGPSSNPIPTAQNIAAANVAASGQSILYLVGGNTSFSPSSTPWKLQALLGIMQFSVPGSSVLSGGTGGGGGAGVDGSHLGGAGGTGGAVVFLAAPRITINGTCLANGANGATSPSATNGGGGGGGGGGLIVTNSISSVVGTPTYTVAGGTGGSGVGTGNAGATGATGTVINNVWS